MKTTMAMLLAVLVLTFATVAVVSGSDDASFFDFAVNDMDGKSVALQRFADKRAILVVNVASSCGYTDQNYRELQVSDAQQRHRVCIATVYLPHDCGHDPWRSQSCVLRPCDHGH